ncbi:hypothetical protein LIER_00986 [Lithospermum erythrorhizon]|uniref:Uncharacterized protein n=1 Tax=Lithospermum erythrorhizon TaxID=34254 RepID=A0AAV3NJA0_LITER
MSSTRVVECSLRTSWTTTGSSSGVGYEGVEDPSPCSRGRTRVTDGSSVSHAALNPRECESRTRSDRVLRRSPGCSKGSLKRNHSPVLHIVGSPKHVQCGEDGLRRKNQTGGLLDRLTNVEPVENMR